MERSKSDPKEFERAYQMATALRLAVGHAAADHDSRLSHDEVDTYAFLVADLSEQVDWLDFDKRCSGLVWAAEAILELAHERGRGLDNRSGPGGGAVHALDVIMGQVCEVLARTRGGTPAEHAVDAEVRQ